LSGYGFAPVRIETREGREEYVELQRGIAERAKPVRAALAAGYRALLAAKTGA
jgi:hypothetical protein